MTKNKLRVFLGLVCVLALTGCVNRAQADAKLAKACEAAVGALLTGEQRIDKVKDASFTASPEGPDFRHVTIHAMMMDGWLETETDYECVFQEGFGFLNSGYTASIYQVKTGERIVGQAGAEIMGDANDFLKITDAVRKSLYEE